jgi:hypothetical protein
MTTNRASFQTEGTYTPDGLIAGDFPIRTRKAVLASGQSLARGALLGVITADGKVTLSASAAADGSQVPNCLLAEDIDASGGDAEAVVYIAGDFNANALTLGAGHTIASVREGLRALSIFLHDPVKA